MDGYSILSYARTVGKPAVLATLIHTEGHSYRKAGASMLMLADGGTIGSLSPGCLETDLRERASALLGAGEAELVTYNMRPEEDAIWGEAVGCGGVLRIALEPLDEELLAQLALACDQVEAGAQIEWVRYVNGSKLRHELFPIGSHTHSNPLKPIENREPQQPLFSTRITLSPRLFIFGADDGTIPIVHLARKIGFRVAIGDWRDTLCNNGRFPGIELAVGQPEAIISQLRIQPADYMLVCSHQLQKDKEMLEKLMPLASTYVGVMGSTSRIRYLLEGLEVHSALRAPVGLDIGADGPEEIAVSIAAELIAIRRGRRERRGDIEDENRGYLFGGWAEQENGGTEAIIGACAR
jgi:xanthine dehydrogenase accessory factor